MEIWFFIIQNLSTLHDTSFLAFYFTLSREKKDSKLIIQRGFTFSRNKKRFQWRVSFRSTVNENANCEKWNWGKEALLANLAVVVIMLDFALLYCEKMKNAEWPRFICTKLIFVIAEDNYADYAAADHPFLITVFHLDSLPPYHETSCISLFMYEKWFKAARESGWEKIRVAISKASFPGSSSLTRYSVNSPLDKLSSLFLFPI